MHGREAVEPQRKATEGSRVDRHLRGASWNDVKRRVVRAITPASRVQARADEGFAKRTIEGAVAASRHEEAGQEFNQVPQVKMRHAPFRDPSHLLGIVPKQNSLLAELRESSGLDKPESTGTNLRLSWLEYWQRRFRCRPTATPPTPILPL